MLPVRYLTWIFPRDGRCGLDVKSMIVWRIKFIPHSKRMLESRICVCYRFPTSTCVNTLSAVGTTSLRCLQNRRFGRVSFRSRPIYLISRDEHVSLYLMELVWLNVKYGVCCWKLCSIIVPSQLRRFMLELAVFYERGSGRRTFIFERYLGATHPANRFLLVFGHELDWVLLGHPRANRQ